MQVHDVSATVLDYLKVGGGIAGLVALGWRVLDEFGSHLRIALKVDVSGDWMTALTTVDNKGNRPKGVGYAMLLIGPETEGPMETARALAVAAGYAGRLTYANDLVAFRVAKPVASPGRALIPLGFYYLENVDIADETLTYRAALSLTGWELEKAYAVRFFLFPEGKRLHRSTQDTFVRVAAGSSTGAAALDGASNPRPAEVSRVQEKPGDASSLQA
jgi:hypothetical protein